MRVKIKKLASNAKIPTKAHASDFCYDVYATSRKRVGWRTWEYSTGLSYEIVKKDLVKVFRNDIDYSQLFNFDYKPQINISIDFRPRSSVWKTGMILSNCEGTLDELYRGEVKAIFYNINPFRKNYKVGDRIGQIKLGFTLPIEFEEVDEISTNTERGTGGFGSTGR